MDFFDLWIFSIAVLVADLTFEGKEFAAGVCDYRVSKGIVLGY